MRAAVLGSPVAHSLSPVLHRAAYAELGIEGQYDAHDVDAAALPGFLAGLGPEWVGLSLTMPLKAAVIPLLDDVTPQAAALRSVNTVVLRDGLRRGSNTDVPGMVEALRAAGLTGADRVTILGGGATGRSALAAAAALGAGRADVAVREVVGSGPDLLRVGSAVGIEVRPRPWHDAPALLEAPLVISTVPASAAAPLDRAVGGGLLFDVLYEPWPTPLAAAWRASGGQVVGGLELLVAQAVLQVAAMTGRPGPAAAMRAAGLQALERRAAAAEASAS